VCSTINTASAPTGSMPPVAMRAASPTPTRRAAARPISTVPSTRSGAGLDSLAPKVELAITAKPSIVARAKLGTSSRAMTSSPSARPRAWPSGTRSHPNGSKERARSRAVSSDTTRKKSLVAKAC
jgi:hypothetical protein